MHRFLCNATRVAVALVALVAGASAWAQDAVPILGVDEIQRGQRGYGLSVFEGSEPARFEVEVLGVIRNSSPGESFVLARLSGQGLEETGVIAGMSGSPVYIDDRLIGAVAFAWPFTNGAVGGITPIESMRRVAVGGSSSAGTVGRGAPGTLAELRQTDLDVDILAERIEQLVPRPPGRARNGLLWSLAGFGDASHAFLERSLVNVAPAGQAEVGSGELVPGSAVSGVLVDGDLQLAVTGTVTDRVGDEILAFGHAFLGQGPIRLPMATADVVTVLSNQFISFKIANVGDVVGAFDTDLASGVRGRLGATVETIPLSISIHGMASADFEMQLADVPAFLPTLVAIASLGALDSASRSGGAQGVDLTARWELERHGEVEVSQSFDGSGAAFSAAIYAFLFTNFIANSDLEETRITDVQIELTQHPDPRTERVLTGFANRAVVQPGDVVGVTLEVQPYRGEPYPRRLEVTVPRGVPEGRYTLIVGDGVTVDMVRQMVEQVEPRTLAQALDIVRGYHSNRDLIAIGLIPAPGLALAGRVLPQLPGSMRQLWGAMPTGGARPLALAVAHEVVKALDKPLSGGVRIDLDVRKAKTTSMVPPTPPPANSGRWVDRGKQPGPVVPATASAAELLSESPDHDGEKERK